MNTDTDATLIDGTEWRVLKEQLKDPSFDKARFVGSLSSEDLEKMVELQGELDFSGDDIKSAGPYEDKQPTSPYETFERQVPYETFRKQA